MSPESTTAYERAFVALEVEQKHTMNKSALIIVLLSLSTAKGFVTPRFAARRGGGGSGTLLRETDPIVSPFDTTDSADGGEAVVTTQKLEGPLELTWENVEKVLDEMRPFLIQDGGNVAITEIDGPVVRLELQVSQHN